MGVDELRLALARHRRLALDTSVFIYHLEETPKYIALADAVFAWIDSETAAAATSTITMTELLVKPYREANREGAERCYGLFSTYPHLEWISPTLQIADIAARIRAKHNLRTPDALQAATAMHIKATALITNDPVFGRVSEFTAIVLDRFL